MSAVGTIDPASANDEMEQLLEDRWVGRGRRMPRRELVVELAMTVVFLATALALARLAPPQDFHLELTVALGVAFAVASRVEIPVGAGYAVPTQLFLVPMMLLGPPAYAPLIVFVALGGAAMVDWFVKRASFERIVQAGGDAFYVLGPALVFVLAGSPDPGTAAWWLYIVAFAAQVLLELGSVPLREWLLLGIPPKLQLKVLAIVWLVDLLLMPTGIVGAAASTGTTLVLAPLAALGVAGVLAILTLDRNRRINKAQERLEALRRERHRLQIAVQRIGDAFASKLDLDALLTITMRASAEAVDADGGRASASSGAGRKLSLRAVVDERPVFDVALAAAESEAAKGRALGSAVVGEIWAVAYALKGPKSPVASGVISLARRGGPFTGEELVLFQHLCEQAGVAAGNVEQHELLHRQAHTDHLTGLANPRRLQELLAQGADRRLLAGNPLALILLDLDNFKQVNDTRGHQTGDEVLRAVSAALRSCCRTTDEPARYGGEELAVVVTDAQFHEVLALAERIRVAIDALAMVDTDGNPFRVSASIGVSEFGQHVTNVSALVAAADAALYRAKSDGKNCVRSPLVEPADEFNQFLTGHKPPGLSAPGEPAA